MRVKHIHVTQDSELLKIIYKQVQERLVIDDRTFKVKLWTKFIFYFLLSGCFYKLLFVIEDHLLFVLCFILYGFSSLLFAFNFSHDFSHNTIFKSKKLNNLCFISLYTIVGAHAEAWKQRHVNLHHYAPNVEDYDSDLKITNLIRIIPNSKHIWYHRFQHIYGPFTYMIYTLFWIFIKDFIILFSIEEYSEIKGVKYHLSFWIQKIVYISYILILPIMLSQQSWYIILIGFLISHLLQSLFLLVTFFMTHHVEETQYPITDEHGYIKTSWLMNQIKSSNDMHPFSETANFILGGFNNHIAHHLFPHIHHIHYPKLSKILYDILDKHNIKPNQTTYWGGFISHLKLLKRMSYAER